MDVQELIQMAHNRLDRQLGDHPYPGNIEIAQTAALIAIAQSLYKLNEHILLEAERQEIREIWRQS